MSRDRPVEAGLKYLVLAGASSAFLLFGMALVYARFGEMEFARIGASVAAGVRSEAVVPVLVLVAGSAMGLYYCLRIIVAMCSRDPGGDPASPRPDGTPVPVPAKLVLAGLTLLLVVLGVFPSPWIQLIRAAVASLPPGV